MEGAKFFASPDGSMDWTDAQFGAPAMDPWKWPIHGGAVASQHICSQSSVGRDAHCFFSIEAEGASNHGGFSWSE